MRQNLLICLLLVLAAFAAYSPVRNFEFVDYDDPAYVPNNAVVRDGLTWEGVRWAFTTGHEANWFPMTWLSYMTESQIFGIDSGAMHVTNVALHGAAAVFLFLVLLRITGARWPSAVVALLFVLHPIHVESVAWVAERKDVLSAMFWFLTMWLYLRYLDKPEPLRYALVLVSFALGLMSKPMLVTLPFVLLLLHWWRKKPVEVWRLAPMFGMAVASSVITFFVQQRGGAVIALEGVPLLHRVANAIVSYVAYLAQMFWPARLAAFYPRLETIPAWQAAGAALILAAISFAAWKLYARHSYFAFGWLWYLGTLVPVIGLVQVGDQSRADRYTYIPLVGIFIMLVWGATEIVKSTRVLQALAALVCVGCFAVTARQVQYWRNTESLFSHAVDVTDGNYIALNGLGLLLRDRGQLDQAVDRYLSALRARPSFTDARINLGDARVQQGRADEALTETLEALKVRPNSAIGHLNAGAALNKLGRIDDAISEYREALRIQPDNATAHCGLGMILSEKGQKDQALEEVRESIRIKPDYADGHYNLGWLLAHLGRIEEAAVQFGETVRLRPNDPEAHLNLGNALGDQGKLAEAIDQFSAAVRLKPDYASAHLNLGKSLAMTGQLDPAIAQLQEALRLDPALPEARETLADALALRSARR